ASTHCWTSLKRSMAGDASEYSMGSGEIDSTVVWLIGSTMPGIAAATPWSEGSRRPSLLRATSEMRRPYSCARTSSWIGVGGGGGSSSGFLRRRNDMLETTFVLIGAAILPATPAAPAMARSGHLVG